MNANDRQPDPSGGPSGHAGSCARLLHWIGRAAGFRATGYEADALACGPAILNAYFEYEQGRPLPRANPRTFTEKLYCRMLDMHEQGCATYTRLSDKLQVQEYVADRIGERYLTPVLWSGDDPLAVPWDRLPRECLLKCNEGSGKGALLLGPEDRAAAGERAAQWLAESYYWRRREYQYWPVRRRLLVEERLADGHPDGPIDYIFFCFDGVPRLVQIGSRSHTIHRFFTPGWEPVRLTYRERYEAPEMPRPGRLEEMLDIAARLSAPFDFVRVDLYCCTQGVRFGELTFTPCAGRLTFDPPEWDALLGDWWHYSGLPRG
ncbi:MAG TPA: ATP-grasp fold amidoligase family protein [Ramlibacter sp.]|uniref:ATP-grasp fold amidoligase family protein n=1 Tax=Ramlibacter sp. TaxID=1917967 RepID=UPI002C8D8330|nr:ATP-grasp fold amidoligase family protein [Ramlibacter sp.]HVZ44056.1 ATP-grasp fold amidoligase family protein [Ramlibacter sp.]